MVLIQPVYSPFICTVLNRKLIGQMAIVFLGIHTVAANGCTFYFLHVAWIALVAVFFYFAFVDFAEETGRHPR